MATFGKWGITRDEDGSLSNVIEWPWYWRYPLGLVLVAASCALGLYLLDTDRREWVGFGAAVLGSLFALMLMRELGCLVLVVAVVAAVYWLISLVIPDGLGAGSFALNAGVFFSACAAFFSYKCFESLEKMKEENHRARFTAEERLGVRLSEIESSLWRIGDKLDRVD